MAEFAKISVFGYQPGSSSIVLGVQLLKGIDNASRDGGADFGLRCTVTYIDGNNVVQTLDSSRLSIKTQTTLLNAIDGRTVLVQLIVPFGSTPLPGPNATFTGTAQVFHRDSSTGQDVELGPAETTP